MPHLPSESPRNSDRRTLLARLAAYRFLSSSLLLHLVLVALLGSAVLFHAKQSDYFVVADPETGFLLDQPVEVIDQSEPEPEFEEDSATESSETETAAQASAIQSLTEAASFSISAPMDAQLFGNRLAVGEHTMDAGSGEGSGGRKPGGGGRGKLSGTLFGVKVETAKLGVMLDVSNSSHPYLLGALREIDRSFRGMPTVLVFGCGASSQYDESSFTVREGVRAAKEYEKIDESVSRDPTMKGEAHGFFETVFGQVALARHTPNLEELDLYFDELLTRPGVYWLVNEKGANPRLGTHAAMRFLAGKGVDTIYWFADFADPFELECANKAAEVLRRKGIKVIAHNFDARMSNSGSVQAAQVIVEGTGGQYLTGNVSK